MNRNRLLLPKELWIGRFNPILNAEISANIIHSSQKIFDWQVQFCSFAPPYRTAIGWQAELILKADFDDHGDWHFLPGHPPWLDRCILPRMRISWFSFELILQRNSMVFSVLSSISCTSIYRVLMHFHCWWSQCTKVLCTQLFCTPHY